MPVKTHKKRKAKRLRGSWSHGYGHKKKHRGAGNRGGRGMAGTGKRAGQKKALVGPDYLGKSGFKMKHPRIVHAITLQYLEERAEHLVREGLIEKSKDLYVADLGKLGFQKLLSKGSVRKKFQITVEQATLHAIEKIQKAGGSVTVTEQKEEAPQMVKGMEKAKEA